MQKGIKWGDGLLRDSGEMPFLAIYFKACVSCVIVTVQSVTMFFREPGYSASCLVILPGILACLLARLRRILLFGGIFQTPV